MNFWDFNAWGLLNLFSVLLLSLLFANLIKKSVRFLKNSLIPTSVLGGLLLLIFAIIYEKISGIPFFQTQFFGGNGGVFDEQKISTLEFITYHSLALGFIASALKPSKKKFNKKRSKEIFDSGVTTVSSYLLQAVLGLSISLLFAIFMKDLFSGAGIILPFGYGQGTGQALNWGNIYENENNFTGGRSFGLTIAALGFLSASIGGVIHLNILKKKGKIIMNSFAVKNLSVGDVQNENEIEMNGSMDKFSVQIAIVLLTYTLTYLLMLVLGAIVGEGLKATIFGFNFLFGVIMASVVKAVIGFLTKKKIIRKQYVNSFLMDRISGFFFDIMVIAGIAAIRIDVINNYWLLIITLGLVGAISTYFYNRLVVKKLFKDYPEEQFLVMYGMLTGTASTGIILLRELDRDFTTPAQDNLIYQQIPAIIFGFPLILLAKLVPSKPELALIILFAFFIVMNIILFRSLIFKRKNKIINENKEN